MSRHLVPIILGLLLGGALLLGAQATSAFEVYANVGRFTLLGMGPKATVVFDSTTGTVVVLPPVLRPTATTIPDEEA